ncbi:MAG: hypothetical protein CL946_05720 [Ectothiorhodospiraceae bacterium]|nr:hypothetical protein [Ectothiorhodospiraceae bacterium]
MTFTRCRNTVIIAFAFIFIGGAVHELAAQPQFILKRTKKEGIPLFFQLYSGFNWVLAPGPGLDEHVSDYDGNTYSGVMIGMQGAMNIDTLARKPLWAGVELYYARVVDRFLAQEPDVYFKGLPPVSEGGPPVELIETAYVAGASLFLAYDLLEVLQLQGGLGMQYFLPQVDIPETGLPGNEVEGLFESTIYPTAYFGVNGVLLAYPHGSINADVRAMHGFGEYGGTQIQILLGFMFNFE